MKQTTGSDLRRCVQARHVCQTVGSSRQKLEKGDVGADVCFSYSISPAATNDKAEWRLLPTVVFQEFSNEERCRKAKVTLEGSLSEAGAKLRSGLEDLKSLGKADPAQIIIAYNVECLPK